MKGWVRVLIMAGAVLWAIHDAQAHVVIHVDKSSQRMTVAVDGQPRYSFVVSTGRPGYGTPNGVYRPVRMERTWFSKRYYNSPMPHSIFFRGGYAIHGSYEISRLGGPASHGCIRLHPENAAELYALVREQGMGATTIVVSGANPSPREAVRYQEPRSVWSINRPYEEGDGNEVVPYRRAYPYASPYSRPYAQPYGGDRHYGDRHYYVPDSVPRPPRALGNRGERPFFFGSPDDY